MFGFFGPKRVPAPVVVPDDDFDITGSHQIVRVTDSPISVNLLLESICRAKAVITVNVSESAIRHNSMILEVVERGRYLVLDELVPQVRPKLLEEDPRIRVRARIDGLDVEFRSLITATGEDRGIPYYKVMFPNRVLHTQKRQYYRAPVPLRDSISLVLRNDGIPDCHGELRDISLGGFSARVPFGPTATLTKGDVLPYCMISLPYGERVAAEVEICHVEHQGSARASRVGARFLNLGQNDTRKVEQLIVALDRERMRNRTDS
ncbi:MAG: flagellar brake protein [Gammaproteobacteria bacterium]|nr:flagellar brake protein [Gammaproteobacteria bacterium]